MPTRTNNAFKTDSVSNVYAQSLFELAQDAGTTDQVTDEMEQIAELLAGSSELAEMFSSRALSSDDRGGIIDRAFKDRASDVVWRFLHVLNRKGRLGSLPAITASFAELIARQHGIIEVDIYTPSPLDGAAADQLARSLGAALGGKQVVLHPYVDASLIGGLKIRVGDQLIDGSVASQLARMKRGLIDAGHNRAKTSRPQTNPDDAA